MLWTAGPKGICRKSSKLLQHHVANACSVAFATGQLRHLGVNRNLGGELTPGVGQTLEVGGQKGQHGVQPARKIGHFPCQCNTLDRHAGIHTSEVDNHSVHNAGQLRNTFAPSFLKNPSTDSSQIVIESLLAVSSDTRQDTSHEGSVNFH